MQRVFITAGASGIGAAHARAFLEQGAQVAVTDIDTEALDAFRAAHPGALAIEADVTDEPAVAEAVAQAAAAFGGLDVVCANAGTGGPAGALETLDAAEWRACIDVNLTGAFLTAKHLACIGIARRLGTFAHVHLDHRHGEIGAQHLFPAQRVRGDIGARANVLAIEIQKRGRWLQQRRLDHCGALPLKHLAQGSGAGAGF